MARCRSYHSFAHRAGYAGLNATASAVHKALTSHLEVYGNNAFSGGLANAHRFARQRCRGPHRLRRNRREASQTCPRHLPQTVPGRTFFRHSVPLSIEEGIITAFSQNRFLIMACEGESEAVYIQLLNKLFLRDMSDKGNLRLRSCNVIMSVYISVSPDLGIQCIGI